MIETACFDCECDLPDDAEGHSNMIGNRLCGSCWREYRNTTRTEPTDSDREPILPTDSEERKQIPIFGGVLNYFPLAIAAVARLSKAGNDKHNPGQPLHWSRDKSSDHLECVARHLIDAETRNATTGEYEDAVALAWRALAYLQVVEEKRLVKPLSRGSK